MSRGFEKRSSIKGLCLTRHEGEQILINNGEILIEIIEIKGSKVRLCFQASKEITISRPESPKLDRQKD